MMLDAEKWAKAKGFNAAYLIPVSEARDFYKKCGYKEIKFGYNSGMFKKKINNKFKHKLISFLNNVRIK